MLRYVVSSTPTLLLRELVTVSLIRFALSCPVVSTSASSCKIVLSPAEALPSRFAATFFVYWKPIPLGSVPRLPSTSATRTTTSRSSRVSHIWLECHSRYPSNGNRPLISQLPFDERITKMFITVWVVLSDWLFPRPSGAEEPPYGRRRLCPWTDHLRKMPSIPEACR